MASPGATISSGGGANGRDDGQGGGDREEATTEAGPPGTRGALDRGEGAPLEASRDDRRRRGLLEQARKRGERPDLVAALGARREMLLECFRVLGGEDAEDVGPEVGMRLGVVRHRDPAPRGRA